MALVIGKNCIHGLAQDSRSRMDPHNEWGEPIATLNILISEDGTHSNHMHNLAKSQSYQGLKLLLCDTKIMTTVNSIPFHHRFQGEPHVCL